MNLHSKVVVRDITWGEQVVYHTHRITRTVYWKQFRIVIGIFTRVE